MTMNQFEPWNLKENSMKPKLTQEEIQAKIAENLLNEMTRPPKLDKCKELAKDVRERVDVLTKTSLYEQVVDFMAHDEVDRRAALIVRGMEGLRKAQAAIDEIDQKDQQVVYDKRGQTSKGFSKVDLEARRSAIEYYLKWNRALEDAIARKNFKSLEGLIAGYKYPSAANFEDVEVPTRRRPNRLPKDTD